MSDKRRMQEWVHIVALAPVGWAPNVYVKGGGTCSSGRLTWTWAAFAVDRRGRIENRARRCIKLPAALQLHHDSRQQHSTARRLLCARFLTSWPHSSRIRRSDRNADRAPSPGWRLVGGRRLPSSAAMTEGGRLHIHLTQALPRVLYLMHACSSRCSPTMLKTARNNSPRSVVPDLRPGQTRPRPRSCSEVRLIMAHLSP